MDESPERRDDGADVAPTEATGGAESGPAPDAPDRTPGGASDGEADGGTDAGATDGTEAPTEELPDGILDAPTSAEEGDHTLLEEYERENASPWRGRLRTAAFWVGATVAAVAVTLTAVVSLRQSGLSDGLAFVLGCVGMAVVVGFVFLSLRR